MIIRSLPELQQADERTLAFGPLGLGGRMRPEDSAKFLQQVMARYELAPAVAEGTRQSFDQLREIFPYGLLCYDIFTLIIDRALLVFEQALRDRFIDFHHGTVTFIDPRTGQQRELTADRYEQVSEFVSRNRRLRLRVGAGPGTMPFNGMLAGLRDWARHTGLTQGQRNRAVEQAIGRLRNYAAHPSAYHLITPFDTANTLSDLAEIINHLWGSPTPGGRLYPAPVRRTIVELMWNPDTGEIMSGLATPGQPLARRSPVGVPEDRQDAAARPGDEEKDDWRHILVRGVPGDWDLLDFDARYATGRYPAEWLWGPGSAEDAAAWLAREQPGDDEADALDRIFLLRYHASLLYLPRNPDQAASVAEEEKPGVWYLIRADSPDQAFSHQRQALAGGFGCTVSGPCPRCPVHTVGSGSWQQAMDLLAELGVQARMIDVPDVRVPSRMEWPRCNRITGNGSWDIPEQVPDVPVLSSAAAAPGA
jgi:hypothetical protein